MFNRPTRKNDVKWLPIATKFCALIENMSRAGLYDCHIFLRFVWRKNVDDFMINSNFGIGIVHVKRQILTHYLWRHFSARSSLYCFIWHRGVSKKKFKMFYGSVFVIWLYLQKAMYSPCDLDLWRSNFVIWHRSFTCLSQTLTHFLWRHFSARSDKYSFIE